MFLRTAVPVVVDERQTDACRTEWGPDDQPCMEAVWRTRLRTSPAGVDWTAGSAFRHYQRMAKNTIIETTDDLDGSKNAQEVSFAFNGTQYTIDLGKKNLAAFEKALKPYIEAAAKVSKGPVRKRRSSQSVASGSNLKAIREWARGAGIEVSERGRIPNAIREQYDTAHKG